MNRRRALAHCAGTRGFPYARVCRPAIVAAFLEAQELVRLSREELERALDEGRFKVLPWATVVALGLRALGGAQSS